ncbi:MAG: NAD(P)/FAD-dependent oxidoreductase [Candidatus Thorarchaeota archaeon]|nr:NAD(P)/FAD-dependent oxidoreductase [Candidatus Thorarchaeota archaeon]
MESENLSVHKYDVIIVGAGPGGSIAAKEAAEKGLKTILFERGRRPGEKNSSGCGLGPRMWQDFDIMKELTPAVCPSMRAGAAARNYFVDSDDEVVSYIMTRPTKSTSYEPAKSFITMNVYRSEFDPWLAKYATDAGAELRTSTLVVGLTREDGKVNGVIDERGEKYLGIVIGADGAISMVARESGLRSKWAQDQVTIVPQYDFQADPQKIDAIMGDEALAVWWSATFPAAYQVFFRDGFHIGLGNWMSWWDKNPLHYLNRCVGLNYFQRLVKILDAKPREFQVHLLPWQGTPRNTHTDNVMLIGDAGGFPCPLEAEGIYPAMITGRAAARVAAEALSDGDTSKEFLSKYDSEWEKTSVGAEFEAGPQLYSIWKTLPFDPKGTMTWLVPLISEVLGGIIDWSQPHSKRILQVARAIKGYLPKLIPILLKEVMPLLTVSLGEARMELVTNPEKLLEAMPELEAVLTQALMAMGEEE